MVYMVTKSETALCT